jgi:hypothetical protein
MLDEVREEELMMGNSQYFGNTNKSAEGKKRKRNKEASIKMASAVFKTPAREETFLYKVAT